MPITTAKEVPLGGPEKYWCITEPSHAGAAAIMSCPRKNHRAIEPAARLTRPGSIWRKRRPCRKVLCQHSTKPKHIVRSSQPSWRKFQDYVKPGEVTSRRWGEIAIPRRTEWSRVLPKVQLLYRKSKMQRHAVFLFLKSSFGLFLTIFTGNKSKCEVGLSLFLHSTCCFQIIW